MSSPKSPYKELGLNAGDVSRKSRPKSKPMPRLTLNAADKARMPKLGHDFQPFVSFVGMSWHAKRTSAMSCRRCGQPRFAVENEKCKGRPR